MVRITTLRLDRVFDVVRGKTKGGAKYAHFGFESEGKRTLDISVPGWPRIESGMAITFVHKVQDDVEIRLLGWIDCYGNRVICTEFVSMLVFALISVGGVLLSALMRYPTIGYVIFGVVAVIFLRLALREFGDHKDLINALESIRSSSRYDMNVVPATQLANLSLHSKRPESDG